MKRFLYLFLIAAGLVLPAVCLAQRRVNDEAIRYQQERMVFKQWDKDKFVPKPGFLYLNPLYWLTWGLHPNYKNTDIRPLGPVGQQTQRLALVAVMQHTENNYKLQSDTLGTTAVSEMVNYSGLVSGADPLWQLYYRHEFSPLLQEDERSALDGLPAAQRDYLTRKGGYDWYVEEVSALRQRLESARSVTLDRGSRILAYHRVLGELVKLRSNWEAKKQYAAKFLALSQASKNIKTMGPEVSPAGGSDRAIAERIIRNSKL